MSNYILHWIFAAISLAVTAAIVPGFTVSNVGSALLAALIVGFLNIFIWPLLVVLTLPLTVVTFGLFLFVINAIILKFGAALVPGFDIQGFLPAVIGAVVLTIVGWMARFVMGTAAA